MSCIDSKNCSEHLLTNEIGLDRAPIEFQKLGFLRPPNYLPQYHNIDDLQLSFSKEFRLSSVLMTFASFCLASEDDNKVQDFAKGKGAVAENGFFFHLGLRNLWAIANCHLMIIVQTDLN